MTTATTTFKMMVNSRKNAGLQRLLLHMYCIDEKKGEETKHGQCVSVERGIVTKNNQTVELIFDARSRRRFRWRSRQSGPGGHSTGENRQILGCGGLRLCFRGRDLVASTVRWMTA